MPKAAVAAITGAGSGIGRALALALAARGTALALADRDGAGLNETVAAVGSAVAVDPHVVDVADRAAVDAFAQSVLQRHGAVDLLFNNAGVSLYGSVAELTVDEIAWLMGINFWGVVYGVKAFLPAMLARGRGTIVNVSSVFGLWGPPGQSAYAASKFAVRGFSESLRAELRGTGIHVATVHPAGIATAIARRSRVAAAADPAIAAQRTAIFDKKLLTIPPAEAAATILAGLDRKRDRILIGRDAFRIDLLTRLFGPRGNRILDARAGGAR